MTAEVKSYTEALFFQAAKNDGLVMSADGRVNERDAAKLLGYSAGHLKALRQEGNGPTFYTVGVDGGRHSYRLADLASWVEVARDDRSR